MAASPRKILVSSALPYANGSIHIGHMLEHIQTDIWVRFQNLRGNNCILVCADDAHGTPIMLKAREEGITAEELIERVGAEHERDFSDFHIRFDNYYTTHSDENRELVETIYKRLDEGGHIARRIIKQAYDEQENMFLPDRYVRGECPNCGAEDQYGDSCEVCSATYNPIEMKNPRSVISGTTPVEKDSEHLFFTLSHFSDMLSAWISSGRLNDAVRAKLEEWFETGLRDWDISRDAPYFGFEIPGEPGRFFYVWLDAPVGYMASFLQYCERKGIDFDEYWKPDSTTELYHFIGKDIIYFHALFWPAVLYAADFRTPTAVNVHGFLTVDGQKMSKRRGTFITARCYLDHLNPEHLRYYFAAKLGSGIEDIDLNLDDFVARVNSDLIGKLVNIASRCAGFITKQFDGHLSETLANEDLYKEFVEAGEQIAEHYERREFSRAMRAVMALADKANRYVDDEKPWVLAKQGDQPEKVQGVCTMGINLFRVLLIYLKPVIPAIAEQAEAFLAEDSLAWRDAGRPLLGRQIKTYKPLATRIDPNDVKAMVEASRE